MIEIVWTADQEAANLLEMKNAVQRILCLFMYAWIDQLPSTMLV